jgi:hypothetical protein
VTADPTAGAFSETWRLRSACGANGCVATASTGGGYSTKNLVFDNFGGRWVAVSTSQGKCAGRDGTELWTVISLQPQADGSMTGEATRINSNGCFDKRSVTVTRTADTDISALPDPAILPPRVGSPAEALHGSYDDLYSFANGSKLSYHGGVHTDCLRTGDRCMSYFSGPVESVPVIFGNGAWTVNMEYDVNCPVGGAAHVKRTSTLPLPQPPHDPITLLSGTVTTR